MINIYQLSVDGQNVAWKHKFERKLKLPLNTMSPDIVFIVESATKTRAFSGAASFKIKYKAEAMTENGDLRVLSGTELRSWLRQVRSNRDWAVNAFVYEKAQEKYADDTMLL